MKKEDAKLVLAIKNGLAEIIANTADTQLSFGGLKMKNSQGVWVKVAPSQVKGYARFSTTEELEQMLVSIDSLRNHLRMLAGGAR